MGDYDRLSPTGWAQARRAGERWRHLGDVHRVVHGSMRRHRESAQGFAETWPGLPAPEEDPRWNEFDHRVVMQAAFAAGQPTPTDKAAFFALFIDAMNRWAGGQHDADYTETYGQFQARVVAGLEAVQGALGRGETALVFTSGGAISAVCRHLLGLTPEMAFRVNLVLVNTGFTRVQVGRGQASLVSLNVTSHLDDTPELRTLA